MFSVWLIILPVVGLSLASHTVQSSTIHETQFYHSVFCVFTHSHISCIWHWCQKVSHIMFIFPLCMLMCFFQVFLVLVLYLWYLFAYILNQSKCVHPYNGLNRKATRKDWRCFWHWRGTEPLHVRTWFPAQHWQWLWRRSVTAGTCQHIWKTWLWKRGLQVRAWTEYLVFCMRIQSDISEIWQWRQQNVMWWKSKG